MSNTIAERLRARAEQLGLNAREVAEQARVNRSFVYDIMRGRSERPNLEKLDRRDRHKRVRLFLQGRLIALDHALAMQEPVAIDLDDRGNLVELFQVWPLRASTHDVVDKGPVDARLFC